MTREHFFLRFVLPFVGFHSWFLSLNHLELLYFGPQRFAEKHPPAPQCYLLVKCAAILGHCTACIGLWSELL